MNFFWNFFRLIGSWWCAFWGMCSSPIPSSAPAVTRAPTTVVVPSPIVPLLPPSPTVPLIPSSPTTISPVSVPTPVQAAPVTTTRAPVVSPPTMAPMTRAPVASLTLAPLTRAPVQPPKPDAIVLINCGGLAYNETTIAGRTRTWSSDQYFIGGDVSSSGDVNLPISNTNHPQIYRSERYGQFKYSIPVPPGNYEIILHFAEITYNDPGYRIFDMNVEGKLFRDIDIVTLSATKQARTAITVNVVQLVDDGLVSISFIYGKSENPKISGIEILLVAPHLAHAVATTGSLYSAVDIDNDGRASVQLDGSASHTHGIGLSVTQWIWREIYATNNNSIVATGMSPPQLSLPVGNHTVSLTIFDSGGNEATDTTIISIYPFGYPAITALLPDRGSIAGNDMVQIIGSGFTFSPSETIVHFGTIDLTGSDMIQIINSTTIQVRTPQTTVGAPVLVTVETPLLTSAPGSYTYIASSEIKFQSGLLFSLRGLTTGTFGPDGKLYLGTYYGVLARLTLNDDYTSIVDSLIVSITDLPQRAILGIAFDPNDIGLTHPPVYCTSSQFFHTNVNSSSGLSINGMIQKVSGANLDIVEDIITGLPVSDHDHGLNGLQFNDERELIFTIGSNTNGGLPGKISGSLLQKENYYSAASIVANIHKANFNGTITYDALDDGKPNGGSGIEIFTSGNRNSFGLTLHSNGYMYATDNGPNFGYGAMMSGCEPGMFIPDDKTQDKLDVLIRGRYYGHPNRIRAIADNDPRQCVWRHPEFAPTVVDGKVVFQKPLLMMPSSVGGIMEYCADHFDRQLRHNLIVVKYTNVISRIILRPDGLGVIPQSNPAIALGIGAQGLSLTQAPDGTIIDIRYSTNSVHFHRPIESTTSALKVHAVFPRRGPTIGGYLLNIFGVNLDTTSSVVIEDPKKSDTTCLNVTIISSRKLTCIMPPGDRGTTVNVRVLSQGETYQFLRGFRYITGLS